MLWCDSGMDKTCSTRGRHQLSHALCARAVCCHAYGREFTSSLLCPTCSCWQSAHDASRSQGDQKAILAYKRFSSRDDQHTTHDEIVKRGLF